ncbi:MAG TPA: hypothetical protein VK827_00540 [Lysobacter sp.]|nr:hypothetical protein [Lysobacter sp.]
MIANTSATKQGMLRRQLSNRLPKRFSSPGGAAERDLGCFAPATAEPARPRAAGSITPCFTTDIWRI